MTSDSQGKPNRRRASCDQCRHKKLKCDGEYPTCSRCSSLSEDCQYSERRPMGRPRKRRLQIEAQEAGGISADDSPDSVPEKTPSSNVDGDTVENGFQFDPAILLLPDTAGNDVDLPSWPCEATPASQTTETALTIGSVAAKQDCACLATMYLALDEVRSTDNMSFATGLSQLRSATAKAAAVIHCPICPTKFVWAMQNAQLMNTLNLSIAEAYQRIVTFIDSEAHRAEQADERKNMRFGEPQAGTFLNNAQGTPSFTLTLSPAEWRTLTKRAVKAELYGEPTDSSTPFLRVLQHMEERQLHWHSDKPPVNFRCVKPSARHDGEPMCIVIVRQARSMIDGLLLGD